MKYLIAILAIAFSANLFADHHHKGHGFKHEPGHHHDHHHGVHAHGWMATIESKMAAVFSGGKSEIKKIDTPFPGVKGEMETKVKKSPDFLVNIAKFVMPQLAVKGVIGFSKLEDSTKTTVGGNVADYDKLTEKDFTLGAGVNYSFMKTIEKTPYAEVILLLRKRTIEKTEFDSATGTNGKSELDAMAYGGRIALGYRYPLFNHISFAPSIDYIYFKADTEIGKKDYDSDSHEWTVNFLKFDVFF